MLYPALDRAGIIRGKRTHGFHLFRHTGGSVVRAVTGDMKLTQIQVGHSSMSTTADVYVHAADSDLERASEVLVKAFGLGVISESGV